MKRSDFLLSIALAVVGVGIVVAVFTKLFRPTDLDTPVAQVEAFSELEVNSVDVIVYGSSRAWRGINTKYMYEKYGINAYNYGCNWQKINTTDLFVNNSLLTQKPKLVIIDMSNAENFLEDTDIVGEVYYTRGMKLTDAKKRYLRQCFGDDYSKYGAYYFPFCVVHSNWNALTEASFQIDGDVKENLKANHGYLYTGGEDKFEKVNITDGSDFWQEKDLPDKSRECLDDMVSVCKQAGAEVMLITIPSFTREFYYRDMLTKYAQDNDCTYLDFFTLIDEVGLDGDRDFIEPEHLNNSGATKLAEYLSEYIIDNKLLED